MNAPNPPKPIISPQKPLVYSYVRFSTAEQRKGTGQARQDSLADKWCLQEGLPLFKNYSDLGVSAFKGKNATEGALSQFLELVKAGQIKTGSILLVESLDRLSRDKINLAAELFLGIVNRGITVVTLCDGYRYAPDSFNFAQLVMSLAIFMRANDESTMKSQRKAGSWKIKRQKAKDTNSVLGGNTPRWIKVVDGKYQLIDDQTMEIDYTNPLSVLSAALDILNGFPPTITEDFSVAEMDGMIYARVSHRSGSHHQRPCREPRTARQKPFVPRSPPLGRVEPSRHNHI